MKIKIVSDLHLEFSYTEIPNTESADVLILSGDIAIAEYLHKYPQNDPVVNDPSFVMKAGSRRHLAKLFRNFFEYCSREYPQVIYVAGNHEFYDGKFHQALDYLKEETEQFKNIHFLENSTVLLDNIAFIGATLWTDMNRGDPLTKYSVQTSISDYTAIRNDRYNFRRLSPADTAERHSQSVNYIKDSLELHADKTCVVVGHHSPSHKSIPEEYISDYLINGAYHSDLSNIMLDYPQVKLWTHGHVHTAFDYQIGECRVVCNPRGYQSEKYKENTGFNPSKVIEL